MGRIIFLAIWFFSAKWIFGALGPHDIQLSLRLFVSGFVPFAFLMAWAFSIYLPGSGNPPRDRYYGNKADYYEED